MKQNDIVKISEIIENDQQIYRIMRQCPYEILRNMRLLHFKAGKFMLKQGEVHDTMYIVVAGELDIYVESDNGKKYYLNTYRKGNYIGELEMFGKKAYISSVEARTNVDLLAIGREDFIQWVRMDRNMNDYFVQTLCDSSYVLCQNMGNNTLYTLRQRICKYLLSGVPDPQHLEKAEIKIRTEDLGERMAVTQRSVNRVLKELREEGLISIERNRVSIQDYQKLMAEI